MRSQETVGTMPTGFRVLRASAGSGKTFKLVEAYLSCCLGSNVPLPFRRILALTFTNKAAQEMKTRVVQELELLAEAPEESAHLPGISEETALDVQEIGRRARAMRTALNRHYGELSIMTLDKFVGGLVRGFATDLLLEHDFSIELDTPRLLEAAVDRVLEQLGQDLDLTELLGRFVEEAVDDDRDAKVRRQLLDIGKSIDQEQMQHLLDLLNGWSPADFIAVQDRMSKSVQQRKTAIKSAASSLLTALEAADLEPVFLRKWVTKNWLTRLVRGQAAAATATLTRGVEEGLWAKKNDEAGEAAIAPFHDRLVELAELEQAMGPTEHARVHRTEVMLGRWLPLVGTLTALKTAHLEVQREENVRTLGALNRMISDVVRDNPAPFIFERTGERYDHIFIDEFQDTSVTQWQNLAVAVGETLGHGHLSLVVGDAKQAIYRWRNGDHRQLKKLPDLIADGPEGLPESLQDAAGRMRDDFIDHPIDDNWRSAPEIVEFNNLVYEALAPGLGGEWTEVYSDVRQNAQKEFAGGVEVEVLEGKTADVRFEAVCEWMEARIRQSIDDGFKAGEIALLVRTNKEAKRLAEYLLSCAPRIVPFTDESLALGRHPAALAVVHLLEAMEEPKEPGPVLKFVQAWGAICVERGQAWDEAELLARHHQSEFYPRKDGTEGRFGRLNGPELLKEVVPEFDAAKWSALPLTECLGVILRKLELDRDYPAHAEVLMELTNERAAMDMGRPGFLAHWYRKGAQQSIRVLPGPDAVRILTVHKSKGLQYPVVITRFDDGRIHKNDTLMPALFADAEFAIPGLVAPVAVLKDTAVHDIWEKERNQQRFDVTNVAYVCTTRAEVRLHVVIDVEKTEWREEELPGTVGRSMARGIEDALGCDLTAGPYRSADFEASRPLEKEAKEDALEVCAIPGFVFHGIPPEMITGRQRDLNRPVLGRMDQKAFGIAVHGQLARIRHAGDVERIVGQPWPWTKCCEDDWKRVVSAVQNVVADPVMSAWFDGSGDVHNERELVGIKGEIVRPDRVVFQTNRVDVIDFKTAHGPNEKQRKKDADQVRGYMNAIAQQEQREVRGFVFYCDAGECVEVSVV